MKTHYERYLEDFLRCVPHKHKDVATEFFDRTPLAFYGRWFDELDAINKAAGTAP